MTEELDLKLDSGRVHAQRFGSPDAQLVLAVHGLSANMHAFDFLAPRLVDGRERQVVALDLRGRGRSDVTPAGTYGMESHAWDVLQAADRLGAERFDWIGWSMGALIGIVAAGLAPGRLRTLGLIDHAGDVDREAAQAVLTGLDRLDAEVADAADYVELMASRSPIRPFTDFWRNYYSYEFGLTSKAAAREDFDDILNHDWPRHWGSLTMPTTLVRCARPIGGGGFVVPETVAANFRAAVPRLDYAEVDADHFTVMTDDAAAAALGAGLDQAVA
jgi:pimeloyl-ACP methyl ester carboxylesterase